MQLREDRSVLARRGIRVFDGPGPDAREVDTAWINWNNVSPDHLTYFFRQEPGPGNPVGHVKFMCPNQFDVYLHDTPSGHLFNASERDFSHGCVRVEHADVLAERLLEGAPHSSRQELAAAFVSSARDSVVSLPRPTRVHLMYWTAWVDDRNVIHFRDHLYRLDRRLNRALRGDSLAFFRVNLPEADSLRYP